LYDHNHEAQEIFRVVQPELDGRIAEGHRVFDNTRVSLSDVCGIEMWERIYGIMPNLMRDNLEERRERILEVMRAQPPFTEPWLREELARRTGDGDAISAEVDWLNLVLKLVITRPVNMRSESFFSQRRIRELLPWLRHIVPANLMTYFQARLADIDFENENDTILMDVAFAVYSLMNITAPRPLWDGAIYWDGDYTWTPVTHGIGFSDSQFADYNLHNIQSPEIRWDGLIYFDGAKEWGINDNAPVRGVALTGIETF